MRQLAAKRALDDRFLESADRRIELRGAIVPWRTN